MITRLRILKLTSRPDWRGASDHQYETETSSPRPVHVCVSHSSRLLQEKCHHYRPPPFKITIHRKSHLSTVNVISKVDWVRSLGESGSSLPPSSMRSRPRL